MTLAELLRLDVSIKNPALRLGRLFPKGGNGEERTKLARLVFEKVANDQSNIRAAAIRAEKRLWQLGNDFHSDGIPVISFTARCATRLITGSASGLPEINSTIVHSIYGYPYLPGSSLKGAVRAEGVRQNHSDLITIFGGNPKSEKEPGEIRFFDAVPTYTERDLLESDVATVHHKHYYEGKLADPEPTESPVPLPFLVVPARVPFRFLVAGCSRLTSPDLVNTAFALLKTVLAEEGIGAGTATGYGYFDPDSVNVDVGRDLLKG